MNSLSTPAIEKALTASVHTSAAAVKGNLFEKIGIYLDSGNGIFDAEMLQLLRDVNAYLKHQIKKTSNAFIELQNTLQKINEKLEKIKRKKMQKQVQRANIYAKIAERKRHGENMKTNGITSPKNDEKKRNQTDQKNNDPDKKPGRNRKNKTKKHQKNIEKGAKCRRIRDGRETIIQRKCAVHDQIATHQKHIAK